MSDALRVHWIQHVPYEGLGAIAPWLKAHGARVAMTRAFDTTQFPEPDTFDWLIVMGGPMGAFEDAAHPWLGYERACIRTAVESGKRVLGICLGAQLIAAGLGGAVHRNAHPEIGWFPVEPTPDAEESDFAEVFCDTLDAFHWHYDTFTLPPDAVRLAYSDACTHQAFAVGARVLALQFHPEMTAEGARAIVAHDGTRLTPSAWVQAPDEMLGRPERYAPGNCWLEAVLDRMAGA
jgi:GMP synthase-like glutamine amidotransferase